MTTLSEVIQKLQSEGYIVDFNLKENCLECHQNALQVHPNEFVVDKHYRFEGMSDPADEAIVYAISSTVHNIKGILVNGYGMSSEPLAEELVDALKEKGDH
ncbi:phosphoribosylpyrophosphate synthetase [Mucilaginibacter sp. HC2]|nr:phosphoribosylpyrophosphate synthetase [Mucilaginibacter inviolabilis]